MTHPIIDNAQVMSSPTDKSRYLKIFDHSYGWSRGTVSRSSAKRIESSS
jgi:hypothetical protein